MSYSSNKIQSFGPTRPKPLLPCLLLFSLIIASLSGCAGQNTPENANNANEPQQQSSILIEAGKRSYGDPIIPELQDEAAQRASVKFPDELYQQSNACYRINMHTPFLGIDAIDTHIRLWAEGVRAQSIREFDEYCADGQAGNTLDLTYETSVTFGNTISVLFLPSSYSGGAHPLTNTVSMNFDTASGKLLEYTDIFNNTGWLYEYLSDYAYRAMKSALGEYWAADASTENSIGFEQGLDPKPENFKNFALTPAGLVLIFPHYQIAPYSEGIQSCLIPLSNLLRFQPRPGVWQ